MSFKSFKYLLLTIGVLVAINSFASKAPGYIITNNSDTIYGEIKIYKTNPATGGFVIIGIDLEQFNSQVSLRELNNKRFIRYEPNELTGFGFLYKSTHYKFDQFLIVSKGVFKFEKERYRFLNLVYKGELSLYHDIVR